MGHSHTLDDKYTAESGAAFMSGTQALVRLPMVQMRRDKLGGLDTATFITGYRGSPMGTYDQQLQKAQKLLEPHRIRFQPGVNEDLAATAIWGTQQVPLHKDATVQGVLGIWYGKGPGVDRSGDVFRHGNAAGSSLHGGVLCIAGDDHSAKSSTVQHQSDHAFTSARMPMLYPSSVHEFIEVGLLGIALSRYSGCWVGMKVISDTVETSAVVNLDNENKAIHIPTDFDLPEDGLNLRWPDAFATQDVRLHEVKEKAVHAFARANGIDQWLIKPAKKRFGIVGSGKAFEDARQALSMLGLDGATCESIGLHLYKVRMPYPLEPQGITEFANGLDEVLVLEERREIIEAQLKSILYHQQQGTRIVGKLDEHGNPYLPTAATLSVAVCMRAIAERLLNFEIDSAIKANIQERLSSINNSLQKQLIHSTPVERRPWFCAGCPHNTSTRVPEGSKALAGIGCHFMVLWMDRDTETFTHMGAEGVPWTAISHYVEDTHRFVNIGDGTYFHSGLLAVRASVASGVNITYKVLYNDAVAMTGGQPIDGGLTPQQITHQLKAEGVWPVYLVTDEPELYDKAQLAAGVEVRHRDYLDAVMKELRDLKGCNGIVYVQTCAAEKRRRRKRGLLPDPDKRLYINPDVCEGCGDCSSQSNCVAVEPLETPFGRKRRINQSSCNKDYSCINGFCPSFVTVTGGTLKRKQAQSLRQLPDQSPGQLELHSQLQSTLLEEPSLPELNDQSWNILVTGVGGTGVLTIGGILGMAAHIDGNAAMVLDMAGLAQKGGAVLSHIRIAQSPEQVTSAHIVPAGCDLLFAADAVVASSKDSSALLDTSRTNAVVNTASAPIADFVLHRDIDFGAQDVTSAIKKQVNNADHFHAFAKVAESLIGDAIGTNIFMLGYAWQKGLLPVSLNALSSAITLNGVAVEANLSALEWGRQFAANAELVKQKLSESESANPTLLNQTALKKEQSANGKNADDSLEQLIEHRAAHLEAYQGKKLASHYRATIQTFRSVLEKSGCGLSKTDSLLRTLAHNYARVQAYKDEYEVSRLFSLPSFKQQLDDQFDGDFSIEFNLAPPMLGGTAPNGRPKKRRMGPWVLKLFALLQKGKLLRGTPFDPFAYTTERRAERAWIKRYENDLAKLQSSFESSHDNHSLKHKINVAQQLLALPNEMRGFGPVKLKAMKNAELRREQLLRQFDAPAPIDLTAAA